MIAAMTTLAPLLERVARAFFGSQNVPRCRAAVSPLDQFSNLLETSVERRLPEQEWSFIRSCAQRHHKTLHAAQRNQMEEAYRLAGETWRQARSRTLSPEGHLLLQVFLVPADAYLLYKRENYQEARQLILGASAIDQRLATEVGLGLFSVHRLQLGHNLLRIHTRLAEHHAATRLGGMLLDYLELRVEPPSDELLCARAVLDCAPDGVLEYYFDKICGELATVLAGQSDVRTSELFHPLAHHAGPACCAGAGFAPHAHAWMRMKQLALSDDIEAFLQSAIALLQLGKMSEPSLWFAAVLEIAAVCRSRGAEARRLADRMVAEASAHTDAPWTVKQAATTTRDNRKGAYVQDAAQ